MPSMTEWRKHSPRELKMLDRKPVCDGQTTGKECKHYWKMVWPVDGHNAEALRDGKKLHFCKNWGSEPLEMDDINLPNYCSRYEASDNDVDTEWVKFDPIPVEDKDLATYVDPDTLPRPHGTRGSFEEGLAALQAERAAAEPLKSTAVEAAAVIATAAAAQSASAALASTQEALEASKENL